MFLRTLKLTATTLALGIATLQLAACATTPQSFNTVSVDWNNIGYSYGANPATNFSVSKGR